ncbi:MAG: PAS domain-containing protein, partial [Anaerolineales bacterium]
MKTDRKTKVGSDVDKAKTEQKRGRSGSKSVLKSNGKNPLTSYEHIPVGIVECSPDARYVNINEEFCRITGYERQELLALGIKDITHEDDYMYDIHLHERLVTGTIPFYKIEKRMIRKDGSDIWVELTRSVVRDEKGKALYTIGAVLDISDRKHVERVLRESVERLRLATESAKMFMWEWDLQTQIYTADDNFEKVLGFSGGLLPKDTVESVQRLMPPEDRQTLTEAVVKAIENHNDLHSLQIRFIDPQSGEIAWMEVNGKIVYDDKGNAQRMFGVSQNITASKKAQEEIRIISMLTEQNPNPVMRITPDGHVLYANVPSQAMLELWKQQGNRTIPAELQKWVEETFAEGAKKDIEITQNGKTFSCTLAPVFEAGYINFYGNDITGRKQAEEKLRESEERFRALVSQATAGIAESDMDSRLIFVNPRFCEMLG